MTMVIEEARFPAPLEISFVKGTVYSFGVLQRLREKERTLLFAVARKATPTQPDELADLLWPELDPRDARNALKVCHYRLRRNLTHTAGVELAGGSYRVVEGTRVDLFEVEALLGRARRCRGLNSSLRSELATVHDFLRERLPTRANEGSWLGAIERRIEENAHEAARLLGEDALLHGDSIRAYEIATQMRACDPYDESARELLIRSHLMAGNRAAAQREFRLYRAFLTRELDAQPSSDLAALL